VKAVIGNDYQISMKKLVFARSTMKENLDKRKFFCSELIAKAFKEAGLIKSDLACSTFYP
jgi:hypothetical protein